MHQRAETITTHTSVGLLTIYPLFTIVMWAPGAVVQWQLPQRGVHFTPLTPHLHPPVMSPRPCRGGRPRLSIHRTWEFSREHTMTAVTFKCLLVMNEAYLMELLKMMLTTDTCICIKNVYIYMNANKASGAWAKFSNYATMAHSLGSTCTAT